MARPPAPATTPLPSACGPQDVEAFLSEAEARAISRGQRMTRIRRKVLRLLLESRGPAKAYDLLSRLDGEGAAKPPTVYRALDFLQEHGLAHKIESLNAYVPCGHTRHSHTAVFLICEHCARVEEIHGEATIRTLMADAQAAGFRISQTIIEVRGSCRTCSA